MTATVGIYTQLAHDREVDYNMIRDGNVNTVLILQPDANKVQKVWTVIKDRPGARIILRVWDWDDGRKFEGDEGVYGILKRSPVELGKQHANQFRAFIKNMRAEAEREKWPFPSNDQLLCHLVNEPDTNNLEEQIVKYTTAAIAEESMFDDDVHFLIFNFGTGHPARQVGGAGTEPDWSPYIQVIRKAIAHGHVVGLHEYYNDVGIRDRSVNPWHVLRHTFSTARSALKGADVIISEYGLEMLVNHRMSDHHGFAGVIPAQQFGVDDLRYYCTNVAGFVSTVIIFASDLPDRVWKTFDPTLAYPEVVSTMNWLWERVDGVPVDPTDPDEPDKPVVHTGSIDPNVALAIFDVESGNEGFGGDGRMKIRFEAHIFKDLYGNDAQFNRHFRISENRPWENPQYLIGPNGELELIHTGDQNMEWVAFQRANALSPDSAKKSISMGIAQIMGFNHERVGYSTVSNMFSDYQKTLSAQIVGFFNYILTDPGLVKAVQEKDWRTIAEKYNGSGSIDVYAPRLEAAYNARKAS